MINRKTK